MSDTSTPVDPRRRWRWSRVALTVSLGVAALLHIWLRLSHSFYFHHDDLWQFSVAQEFGLSWHLLSLNVFGHFAPFNRFVHYLFVQGAEVDLQVGLLLVSALVVAFLGSVLWLAYELGLSFWRRTFLLAATGFSVAVLDTAVWLDGAVHIFAALTVTYLVVAMHLRGLNTGRVRWHVLSVITFGLGFATQERVAFALPLIVLADLFLVGTARPWRERWAVLRSTRWPLAFMAVMSATAVVLLRLSSDVVSAGAAPTLSEVGRVFAGAVTSVLFPMLVGLVPAALPPAGVQVAMAVVLALAAALVIRRDRANAGPLLVILLTAVLYYGFLIFSPLLTADDVQDTALRMNNAIYLLVPTLVALASLRVGRSTGDGAADRGAGAAVRPWRGAVVAPTVVAVTVVLLVITAGSYTERALPLARDGHAWLQAVQDGKNSWADPSVTLLPLRAPTVIADNWATIYGREAHFLKYYDGAWAPSPLGDRPVVIDNSGQVRDVLLREEAAASLPFPAGRPGCLESEAGNDQVEFRPAAEVRGAPLFARLDYRLTLPGGGDGTFVVLSARDDDGEAVPSWQSRLPAGGHTVVVPLHPQTVSAFSVGQIPVGATLCVDAATIVRPLYEQDGRCQLVDAFGAGGRLTDCPVPRPPA